MPVAIRTEGLSKQYQIGQFRPAYGTLRDSVVHGVKRLRTGHVHEPRETIWALKDVSFEAQEGEVLGVIGANGAGKSTLLKVLSRITTPTEGRAEIRGRVGSLLEVGTGFHPELTGRENIYLNGSILGMRRFEINRAFDEIVEFSGVEKFIDTPVKRYSSGMYVRLAFSVAAHFEPEVMIVDEVLAVGDAEFQRRSMGRMESLGDSGRTIVFVSHNLRGVLQLCDRAILLDGGRVVASGPTPDVVAKYEERAMGTGSEMSWLDDGTAPANDFVRLQSVRVVDEDGDAIGVADVRRPVGIEIGFTVLRPGRAIVPKIKLWDQHGTLCFNAMDVSTHWHEPQEPGDYVTTAWIPGNLLNEGHHGVDVEIVRLQIPKPEPQVAAYRPVAFHVYDPGEGDSARGLFVGQWKGSVRPLLEWTTAER
jgi:homopolymeric O-antigen transport system ATP-binding protein